MHIDIAPHSIILLIGPSNCGKTFFAKNILAPQLRALPAPAYRSSVGVSYISSDECRWELLGDDTIDRHNYQMLPPSYLAFDLLFKKIETAASWPVNNEFIIVDTKGVNDTFRKQIYRIAKEKSYSVVAVLFQFADAGEYYVEGTPKHINKSIMRDAEKMRSGLRRELQTNHVHAVTIPSRKAAREAVVISSGHENFLRCCVSDKDTLIIGDVHGCYDELLSLLARDGIEVAPDGKIVKNEHEHNIVLVGDFLDKGPKISECLHFVAANICLPNFKAVIGNHERRDYREIAEGIPRVMPAAFDAYDRLSVEDKELFVSIFPKLVPFVRNTMFVATHAPCRIRHAGKLDNASMRNQRYYRWTETLDKFSSVEEMLAANLDLFADELCTTYHVFGHVPTARPGMVKNRILLDGGCSVGGSLCAVKISPFGKPVWFNEKSRIEAKEILLPYREPALKLEKFQPEPFEEERMRSMAERGIAFVSGTMSPAPVKDGQLESIASAVDYFRNCGIKDVVMQCKYMGSRCNVYLTHDNKTSFAVSRNGWVIKENEQINLAKIFEELRRRFAAAGLWGDLDEVIIDGELMPWAALGGGLIEKFKSVGGAVSRETMWLAKTGFLRHYAELEAAYNSSGFAKDARLSKKEMLDKYGKRDYETFSAFEVGRSGHLGVSERKNMNSVFMDQVRIYGRDGEAYYKPFSILKLIYRDGREIVPGLGGTDWTNPKMFELLNDDSQFVYDLSSKTVISEMESVFKTLTGELEFEGVVIKPVDVGEKRSVPYMKVRNPKYLTIVYGYDYTAGNKYQKLCERKKIGGKLRLSSEEWKLGNRMLAIPRSEISSDNEQYAALAYSLMRSVKQETSLDPRL